MEPYDSMNNLGLLKNTLLMNKKKGDEISINYDYDAAQATIAAIDTVLKLAQHGHIAQISAARAAIEKETEK
jgi:hypothetical protein